MVTPGLYKHYKGQTYRVLMVVKNANNKAGPDDWVVVYCGTNGLTHARDAREFEEKVEDPQYLRNTPHRYCQRFTRIGD